MGMGLSIARTIIEAHHGQISARKSGSWRRVFPDQASSCPIVDDFRWHARMASSRRHRNGRHASGRGWLVLVDHVSTSRTSVGTSRDLRLANLWHENPNHWRAITRLNAAVRSNVVSPPRVQHIAVNPISSCRNDHEPNRRAFLAIACLVCRALRCGDLGVILACIQHFRVFCDGTGQANGTGYARQSLGRTPIAFAM